MGYTRYWDKTDKPITQTFLDTVNKILERCKKMGITIKGWDGEYEPEITLERVAFNGDESRSLAHESFVIDNNKEWTFCKTARKPYDYAVRCVLAAALKEGIVKNVSSDGKCKIVTDEEYLDYLKPF